MTPKEIKCIESLLSDVDSDLCEANEPITMHVRLDELYEIIKRLMDATFQTTDTEMKVKLAHLEYRAREYRQMIQDNATPDRTDKAALGYPQNRHGPRRAEYVR